MRSALFVFISLAYSSSAQLNIIGPIEYSGYEESARTVHFSEDGKTVLGDWNDVVEWDIASQKLLHTTNIPGYTTAKSSYDGTGFWMNVNSNYNSEAKDITNMHSNLNVLDSNGMVASETERSYALCAIIKGTRDAIVAATTEKYSYQVVRINTETLEETTLYFNEDRDGSAVPTAIKVSDNGRYVGVSFAGEKAGVRIYDLESGTQLKYRESDGDANDLAFSSDGNYVFIGDGASLVQINIKYWRDVRIWDVSGNITSLDVNSDGTFAVFSFQKRGAVLLNVQNGAIEANLGNDTYWDVTFSDNDELIGLGVSKRLKKEGIASVHVYQILK